jgi:hypothetical protein
VEYFCYHCASGYLVIVVSDTTFQSVTIVDDSPFHRAGLGFIGFLLLFVWNIHGNISTSTSTMQARSMEGDLIVIGTILADLSMPGLIVTVVLAIGALYCVLVIWTLRRMRPETRH